MSRYDTKVLGHANIRNYWKFNESSGTTVTDYGPSGDNLTLTSAGGHNVSGGPVGDMGYNALSSARSAYSTVINLSSVGQPVSFGYWARSGAATIGDWAGNNGPMMFSNPIRLYYNGTIAYAGMPTAGDGKWHFIVACYDGVGSGRQWRMFIDGQQVTANNTSGANFGAGASRFEIGSYSAGGGGFQGGDVSGAFIITEYLDPAWIAEAYHLYDYPKTYDYRDIVTYTKPSGFWPLQGDLSAEIGRGLTDQSGTAVSYTAGPGAQENDQAVASPTLRLDLTGGGNTSGEYAGYSYGGWFRHVPGANNNRVLMGNWDTNGSMIYTGDNSTGNNDDFAIYHENNIFQMDPPANYTRGDWFHIIVTYDGSTQRIYWNGIEHASVSRSGGLGTSQVFMVGTYNGSNSARGDLEAAWLAWWSNKALNDTEVWALCRSIHPLWATSRSPLVV